MLCLTGDWAFHCARNLAADGYAVFPCWGNKKPANRHGFREAVSHPAQLDRSAWGNAPLIGVATGGPSKCVVLDVDCGKHAEARGWYEANRNRLHPTRAQVTPSGGLHLFFLDPGNVGRRLSALAKGIDVCGNDGYVVYWYAAGFPLIDPAPMAAWPSWISDTLNAAPERQTSITSAASISTRAIDARAPLDGDEIRYPARHASARVRGLVRIVASAPEGQRNNKLNFAAYQVRTMLSAGALDDDSCAAALRELADAARQAGLAESEILRTIKSAARA